MLQSVQTLAPPRTLFLLLSHAHHRHPVLARAIGRSVSHRRPASHADSPRPTRCFNRLCCYLPRSFDAPPKLFHRVFVVATQRRCVWLVGSPRQNCLAASLLWWPNADASGSVAVLAMVASCAVIGLSINITTLCHHYACRYRFPWLIEWCRSRWGGGKMLVVLVQHVFRKYSKNISHVSWKMLVLIVPPIIVPLASSTLLGATLKGSRCRLEGGLNSRTWKFTNFFAAVSPGPESPDIFSDTSGNPENLRKCPDCPACEGGIKFNRN
jgi:hypothetical protein